jgi:hypothetical protein
MHRRMMTAALAAMGAASITLAPSYAQDQSPQNAKKATESAPVSSGIMPAPSPRLGSKRSATSQDGPQLQSQKAVRPLTLSPGGAPNLPVR